MFSATLPVSQEGFVQMIDTFIIALKKNPLTFLQMYHHNVIVVLVWCWQQAGWSLSWYDCA